MPVTSDRQSGPIDPRRLLVFREVGHAGSLAAAARTLGWTQPAVSQHVRRLERDLRLALIARAGRGIVLTEPGRLLLRHADAVAARLDDAREAMSDLAGLVEGRVRLAAFPSACATIVSAAVSRLACAHPRLDVRLNQVEPPDALGLLARADCDVAIVFSYDHDRPRHPSRATFETVPLLDDPLKVVLPPGHPLSARGQLTLSDLAAERWISGCPSCREHLLISAGRAGFIPDIRHSTDDYVVVQSLVAAGLAVALLPDLALTASQHAAVSVLHLADHPPRRISGLLMPESRALPAVEAALEHLQEAATKHQDQRENTAIRSGS